MTRALILLALLASPSAFACGGGGQYDQGQGYEYGNQYEEACDPDLNRDLRIGQIVWTRAGTEARIRGFFPDGRVSVQALNSRLNYTVLSRDLAARGCYLDLCSGQRVLTQAGSVGVVNGAFPTGNLSVRINGLNYEIRYEDLAPMGRGRY